MKNIKKIMDTMEKIEYGFLDENGNNIIDNNENIFNKIYHLMSPEELLNKKVGVCWDQVELERKLFDDKKIKTKTYFIYIDDKKYLPSHTFLTYYENDKIYWFEHSWYDQKGIHEYNNLNQLLNDVELKFKNYNEMEDNLQIHIYEYNKPNYNLSCEEFFNYIFTQKEIFNYKLENARIGDIKRIKYYNLKTITEYADKLSDDEMNEINKYINNYVSSSINEYKNIIYNKKIIGSILISKIDNGFLLDEIFIEEKYRNKKIGSTIIKNLLNNINENIYLWVYKDNVKAIKLYKNLGFKIINETDSRYYMVFINENLSLNCG